ncbi:hypothetical protein M0R45_007903 [Rubus argutus]|uniref:Uncharacterized protein n=1 Tax=Rubus argutus TaxID=59490 RepID=A0AAW1Y378_RUBAR
MLITSRARARTQTTVVSHMTSFISCSRRLQRAQQPALPLPSPQSVAHTTEPDVGVTLPASCAHPSPPLWIPISLFRKEDRIEKRYSTRDVKKRCESFVSFPSKDQLSSIKRLVDHLSCQPLRC